MPVGDVLELVEPRRRAEHVDDDDRPRARRDARLDVGRVEVERIVDLGEDRQGAGIHDRRDRGHVREPGHDHLIARPDAERRSATATARSSRHRGTRGRSGRRPAPRSPAPRCRTLAPNARIVVAAVAAERSVGEDLHDLGDLFLADQLYARSGHAGLPLPSAVQPIARHRYQHDNLTVNSRSRQQWRVGGT